MTMASRCNIHGESRGQSRVGESMDTKLKCRDDAVWPGRVTTRAEQEGAEVDGG